MSHVLTKAVGIEPVVDVDTHSFAVVPGDRLLLCSDGLADYIPSEAWLAEELLSVSVCDIPAVLVDHANRSGGHDNVMVVAIGLHGDWQPKFTQLRCA